MEGITGVTAWPETEKTGPDYEVSVKQMTAEVKAACRGALRAGVQAITVQDAHDKGRNIDPVELPVQVSLIRGWSGHPFSMVQELDSSYDAAVFIGYHSGSGSARSPLSHTMHTQNIREITINGLHTNEFLLHAYAAAYVQVPVIFVSGDEGLGEEVKQTNPHIGFAAVKQGRGSSTINIHPQQALTLIEEGVHQALNTELNLCRLQLPEQFEVEVAYADHSRAYRASFYPGMKQISSHTVRFSAQDYFDVLRMILFLV